jgi:hypothetical protein
MVWILELKDVFEAKVFNMYGTFDQIANKSMQDPSYAYLHCDLLDRAIQTTITFKVQSPHIDMHE